MRFLVIVFLSFWESIYCLLHRLVPGEYNAEERINKYIREHRRTLEEGGNDAKEVRIAIVTGANGGIGFETAKALGRAGFTTILACRSSKRAQQAQHQLKKITGHDGFVPMELDLASFRSIDLFALEMKRLYKNVNVLVCNAGVAFMHYDTTFDGLESQFGTNYIGHYLLVQKLVPLLQATLAEHETNARVIVASSIAAGMIRNIEYKRITDVWRFSRFGNYATSKLALVMFSNMMARTLAGSGVNVNAFHPGLVATGLYRHVSALPGVDALHHWLWLDQATGATTAIFLALAPKLKNITGCYFAREQKTAMPPIANDCFAQDNLQEFTDKLIAANIHPPGLMESIN
ncbi:hypothetical protein H4R24_003009 [Coemansia sp. RSA 988]|nr:hypothetical protein H4R24_003009 [Coemansia sp. RSA 988]